MRLWPSIPPSLGASSATRYEVKTKSPEMVEVAHGDRWGAFVTGSGTFAGVDQATELNPLPGPATLHGLASP